MKQAIVLNVNGQEHRIEVKTHHTLLQVLRDQLKLVGVREACGMGECGACTVLVDGEPATACLVLAATAQGREILTIEGLADGDRLHPIQEAFYERTGFQCAYCTPGIILMAKALLAQNPNPTRDQIKEHLVGNLCRCGAHQNIIESIELAARKLGAGVAVSRILLRQVGGWAYPSSNPGPRADPFPNKFLDAHDDHP